MTMHDESLTSDLNVFSMQAHALLQQVSVLGLYPDPLEVNRQNYVSLCCRWTVLGMHQSKILPAVCQWGQGSICYPGLC